jgi:Asp/Glu/hydantoin racemase
MRLLLINPNTTRALTDRLAASASQVLENDVELLAVTAERGFPYISSRSEAQIAGAEVLATLARQAPDADAAIIAAFGDPGLRAARELFDVPVAGMTEASMLAACSLGDRFAFVTFTPALGPWYLEQVRAAGLDARFAGIHAPDGRFGDIATVAEDMRTVLAETCHVAARTADVLILAGAPIAGLAPLIRDEVPAILIDPVQAAVLNAVGQWRLAPRGADRGSFARPPAKPSTGLAASLARWISRDEV